MKPTNKDRLDALGRLSDEELKLLSIDDRPVFISRRLKKLEKLANGNLPPQTRAQSDFINVCKSGRPAVTPYERAYQRYQTEISAILLSRGEREERLRLQQDEQLGQVEQVQRSERRSMQRAAWQQYRESK